MKTLIQRISIEITNYKSHYLILLLFIILSAYVRLPPIIQGNFPFLFDHGRDLEAVKKIVVEKDLTLIGPFTGLKGVFHGALHYYLLAIPFILTGGNPASPIYFLIILALVGIISIYIIFTKLFNREVALIGAAIFALAIGSINFSQHFWNPYWIPFLMIFWLTFFYLSLFRKNSYLVLTFFIAGIITQCDIAFGVVLIPTTILGILIFNIKAFKSKHLYLGLLAYALTFAGHALFELRHDFLMTRAILNLIEGKGDSLGFPIPFPTRFFYRVDEIQKATVLTLSSNQTLSYLFFAITLVGLTYITIFNKKDRKNILFLLLAPITYFIFFLLYPRAAWSWYWVGLQVPYYLTVAYVLGTLFVQFSKTRLIITALLTIWAIVAVLPGSTDYLNTEPGIYKNEMRAIQTAYQDAQGKPFSIFVYTPPIYTYNYDYLTWWYAKSTKQQPLGQSKDGLFYLIIEQDKQNPHAPKGWKETVIKEGETIWSKKLPGNITIERMQGKNYSTF